MALSNVEVSRDGLAVSAVFLVPPCLAHAFAEYTRQCRLAIFWAVTRSGNVLALGSHGAFALLVKGCEGAEKRVTARHAIVQAEQGATPLGDLVMITPRRRAAFIVVGTLVLVLLLLAANSHPVWVFAVRWVRGAVVA